MTKEFLIIKNIGRENPGLLEDVLKEHKINSDVIGLHQIGKITSLQRYEAVIVLGGPASANDLNNNMNSELALIQRIITEGIPYLGICLGLQTLVKAMGGEVVKCQTKEVGFRDITGEYFSVELTPEGKTDPLFKKLPDSLRVFQLHGETVILTQKMTLLAKGKFCHNQIIKTGLNSYGIQSHFELTHDMLEEWIAEDTDLQEINKEQLLSDFESIKEDYKNTGRQLFHNFLNIAGFI